MTLSTPLRVLHIEDVEDDALLVELELRRGGWLPGCSRAETAEAMRAALRSEPWDLVISDFSLPAFDAPSALRVLHECDIDIPFIIVSGTITEEAAVSAMKAGAHDWVTKANLKRLVPAVRRELREADSRHKRRRAEHLHQEAEARFRTLVDSIDGIVFTVDSRFMIDGVFGRGLGHGRLDESRYTSKDLSVLFGERSGELVYSACDRAFAGEPVVQEWAQDDPLGVQHLQLCLSPIRRDERLVLGLVGLVRDISQQKNVQAQLCQADRLASIGLLAAGVGHEINNPLAALMANLDVAVQDLRTLSTDPSAAPVARALVQVQEGLGDACEAAQRIRQAAGDLRVVSRATDQRLGPVDVEQVLESSARMAWNEIRHRARLVRDYQPVSPVLATEARLGQVFLNLLINAAQAIPAGNAAGNEIRMRLRARGSKEVLVEIEDTGQGIPDALKQHLFMPFVTSKPEGAGTGLGLSICQRIVTSFGGDISAEGAPGRGTVFRVTLPASATTANAGSEPALTPRPLLSSRRGRLLVVDDEVLIQRAVQRTLGRDHEVVSLDSGRAAVELIEAGQIFDVIFCDVMMPEMTGIELYTAMKAIAPNQAQRIIFMTGGTSTEGTRAFLDHVPNLTIDKPFDSKHLRQIVAERVAEVLPAQLPTT